MAMARYVLVHGAFGGGWCWEPVVPGLEVAGNRVEAFDLPGAGDDDTPVADVTLDAYADRVCDALASDPEPAVLVGHSMGGMAVTHAAGRAPEQIAALIYVCAFLPPDGMSLVDLVSLPEGQGDQVQANMVVDGDPPVATMPPEGARRAVFSECDEEQIAWAVPRRRPQPVVPFTQPVAHGGEAFAALPRTYVVCARDQSIPPALQRWMVAGRRDRRRRVATPTTSRCCPRPTTLVAALNERAVTAAR